MTKPIASAIFSQGYGTVNITKSRAAAAGTEGVQFYAPTWRAMCFRTIEAAKRKMERHPNFVAWVA